MADFSHVLMTADFDRTLTDTNGLVPQANVDAILRFIRQGGAFTINTGRSLPMLQSRLPEVPVNAPLLLYNGAMAYDASRKEILFADLLGLEPTQILPALRRQFPQLLVEVQGLEAHYIFQPAPQWHSFGVENHRPGFEISYDAVPDPFLKIAIFGSFEDNTVAQFYRTDPEQEAVFVQAQQWIQDHYGHILHVDRGAPRILDVQRKGATKGRAARRLAQMLGRTHLVCVGDGTNDLTMLLEGDESYIPTDADSSLLGRFPALCPCGEGIVAAAVAKLEEKMQ